MWRIIGQPNALALFENSLQTGNLSHAYLFLGPRHVGKTTLAIDLAQALNCSNAEPPCGECQSCRRIKDNKHADIIILGINQNYLKNPAESSSHTEIGIKEIQELQKRASLPPFEGKWTIFIIENAENLSPEASNCLLKILEEPPPRVLWILLATDKTRLLTTVISRCQCLELQPLSTIKVENILVTSHGIDKDKARLLSRLSGGCLGLALLAATDDSYLQQRSEQLLALFPLLKSGWEKRFDYIAQIENDRKSAEELIKFWLIWWRDVMLIKYNCIQAVTNIDFIPKIEDWSDILTMLEIKDFIISLKTSQTQITQNANIRLVLEVLMLDMPRLDILRKEGTGHAQVAMPLIR
jgi:DNA polymerase-3 subunit delta'